MNNQLSSKQLEVLETIINERKERKETKLKLREQQRTNLIQNLNERLHRTEFTLNVCFGTFVTFITILSLICVLDDEDENEE